jgi:hypothetical protein
MKNAILTTLVALAAAPALVAAQSTSASATTTASAQVTEPQSQARIDAAMQTAAKADVPSSLLTSKVNEGQAKHVPPARIATAVEARLHSLLRASAALKQADVNASDASTLSVASDALEAGVSQSALVSLSRSAPADRRVVAVAVLTDLVRLGQSSDAALARVNGAVTSNQALANLNAQVASQLRLGGLTSTLDAAGLVHVP